MIKYFRCFVRNSLCFFCYGLLSIGSLQAQETFMKVPLELQIENTYTQKKVQGAKVAIYRKEVTYDGDKIRTRVRTLYSDTLGHIQIDLAPDFTYLIATEKENFYRNHTPITLPKYPKKGVTTQLSVSLRPKNYQGLRFLFSMQDEQGLPDGLELKVIQRESEEQFWWPISSRGMADLHLPIQATYDVNVIGEGIESFKDSLRLWAPTANGVLIQKSWELRRLQPLWDQGDTLPISPVEFVGRSTQLLDGALIKLGKLQEILERFPQLEVVVEVYTDARGETKDNQQLAEQRISALKEIMAEWQVSMNRIRFKAMGDRHLLNDCMDANDCLEEQHQVNNRVLVWVQDLANTQ